MFKSPETVIDGRRPVWRMLEHLLTRKIRRTAEDLRNIPRYVVHALTGVAVVCGVLCLWESHGDGKMPRMSPLSGLDPYRISSAAALPPRQVRKPGGMDSPRFVHP